MPSFISKPFKLKFSKFSVSKFWLDGDQFKTHLLNSFHILFPLGEHYFVRSMRPYLNSIKDPQLKKELNIFLKQEMAHAKVHSEFLEVLEEQGYPVKKWSSNFDRFIKGAFEPVQGDKLNLATTAALEHFTSLLAQLALKHDFFEGAPESLKSLFEWHALEEIEHRSVAYDVLNSIDDHYTLRVLGLLNATLTISSYTTLLIILFYIEDTKNGETKLPQTLQSMFEVFFEANLLPEAIVKMIEYLDPNFHPSQDQVEDLLGGYSFSYIQEQVA